MTALTISRDDATAVLTIDLTGEPVNKLNAQVKTEFETVLTELRDDPAVRALVLVSGKPDTFIAGADIEEFTRLTTQEEFTRLSREGQEMLQRLDDFPKPTVAAVNGLAYGGGLELAVCCDIIVVAEHARLALPEIKLGIFPATGGTYRVPRRVGEGRSKIMMFTGEPIDAATALQWGLVEHVVPADTVLATATELAQRIATGPGNSLQLCKRAIDESLNADRHSAIKQMLALSDEAFCSDECKEGVRAFLGKDRTEP